MSDLLSIGASGVRAYQTALNVIGENISNASTTGYTRRDVVLKEVAPGAGSFPLQINSTTMNGGVNATGVSRSYDQFRAAEVRTSTSDLQRTNSSIPWLQQVENILDNGGLSDSMAAFFNAAQGVAADPTSPAPRQTMIQAADALASTFHATGSGLAAVADDLKTTAQTTVDQLNSLAKSLATANAGLARATPGTNGQAQLMDERDRLLDQMSQIASISVSTNEKGAATVSFNDANGAVLVDGGNAKTISLSASDQGVFAYALNTTGGPQALQLRSGSLAGLADAALRVGDARNAIDQVAGSFIEQTKTVQMSGVDLNGTNGQALFDTTGGAAGMQLAITDPSKIAAAGRWAVTTPAANTGNASISVAGGPDAGNYRIGFSGGQINLVDPATGTVIASSSYTPGTAVSLGGLSVTVTGVPADGDNFGVTRTQAGSRDNSNLLALAALRTSGGYETSISNLTTQNASAISSRQSIADAQTAIVTSATSARDAVSGVNLDNEAVDLMRYQQAYSASSRVIQVARDIFQTILDIH
jgi:flagellar hook-associated protein 1 FlgK